MSTELQIKQKFASYLNRKWIEAPLWLKLNKPITQSELARLIDVPNVSLNQWMLGSRLPDESNRDKLAAFFGVEIYDLLEVPRKIPPQRELARVIEAWGMLPPDVQKTIADDIEDKAAEWQERTTATLQAGAARQTT